MHDNMTVTVVVMLVRPHFERNLISGVACLKSRLHSFEEPLLKGLSHSGSLVDDCQAMTNRCCLFQPGTPPHCILLKGLKHTLCDRNNAMKLCLQHP